MYGRKGLKIAIIVLTVALVIMIGISILEKHGAFGFGNTSDDEGRVADTQIEEVKTGGIDSEIKNYVDERLDEYSKLFVTKDSVDDLVTDSILDKIKADVIMSLQESFNEARDSGSDIVVDLPSKDEHDLRLDELGNVKISADIEAEGQVAEPEDGQTLVYNGTTKLWENKTVTSEESRVRKNITDKIGDLSKAISEQDLGKYGINIGDYFKGPSGYIYTIADLDTFYGGYNTNSIISTHHAAIIVDPNLTTQWDPVDSTATGYANSNLHLFLSTAVMQTVTSDMAKLFGGSADKHLICHPKLYTNAINSWNWYQSQYICALSETQVYGSTIWSLNGYQTGEANKPLEVFRLYKYNEIFGNGNVWLRSISSDTTVCCADASGYAGFNNASAEGKVAGLILIK